MNNLGSAPPPAELDFAPKASPHSCFAPIRKDRHMITTRHVLSRRALIGGMGGAFASLLATPRRVMADRDDQRRLNDPFILLLKGVYAPVAAGKGPGDNLGLSSVQFAGDLCAYHLPGGSIAMRFLDPPKGAPPGFSGFVPFPDGAGGAFLEGTFELTIIEATGIFQAFKGGHNHMVDRLHQLANGNFDEFCFCNISQYQFP